MSLASDDEKKNRPHRPNNPSSDARFTAVVILGTLVVCLYILWQQGLIGSGAWTNSATSKLKFPRSSQEFYGILEGVEEDVLLVVYSESCPHCRKMRRPMQELSAEFGKVKFVAMKLTDAWDMAKRYKVKYVPVFLWFRKGSQREKPIIYDGRPEKNAVGTWIRKMIEGEVVEE